MIHKKFTGKIISNKMDKTVVVAVEKSKRHPLYEKVQKTTKKFKAHTEEKLELGAVVVIEQTRPLSRDKFWKVIEVVAAPAAGKGKKE
ncbi:MAG: 30S ribosomal protein S17 [Patescibacteria group bacterium]